MKSQNSDYIVYRTLQVTVNVCIVGAFHKFELVTCSLLSSICSCPGRSVSMSIENVLQAGSLPQVTDHRLLNIPL